MDTVYSHRISLSDRRHQHLLEFAPINRSDGNIMRGKVYITYLALLNSSANCLLNKVVFLGSPSAGSVAPFDKFKYPTSGGEGVPPNTEVICTIIIIIITIIITIIV